MDGFENSRILSLLLLIGLPLLYKAKKIDYCESK
jgi:hypothetical protein